MGKLSQTEIDEYFHDHLPYRTRILKAHKVITDAGPYNGNPAILQACFEASLITGRMYLNVLGISKDKNGLIKARFQSDDVTAEDLGGEFIDQNLLSQTEKEDFKNFLIMADKGSAHLTMPKKHEWEKTHVVIDKILYYVKTNIYDKAGRQF